MTNIYDNLVGLCRLNRLLRFRSHCQLIGAPPIITVAKHRLYNPKGHLIKTNEANKDNPSRDNLWPLVVRFSLLMIHLLVTQVSLLFNKASMVSNKVILLDKLVNRMFTQTNLMSSMVQHLDKPVN